MLKQEKGMTIIEVMVAIGLVAILSVAIGDMLGYFSKTTQTYRRSVVRDNIQQNVARFSNLPQQLRNSIAAVGPYTIPGLASSFPDNVELRNCIDPNSNAGASDCTAGTWYGFTLLQGAPGSSIPLAGPSGEGVGAFNPVRYSNEGAACDTAGTICLLRVYTAFRATCSGPSPCRAAATLDIKYYIDQDPAVNVNPRVHTITDDPTAPNPQPLLSVAIPLAAQFNGASTSALAFWSSTTDLATSKLFDQSTGTGSLGAIEVVPSAGVLTNTQPTLLAVDGAIRPGSGAAEACGAATIGAIRRDNGTNSLQICTVTTAGVYAWKWIGGATKPVAATGGSGGSTGGAAKFPYLPNLYLCGNTWDGVSACGGIPPCVGQMTNYGNCCQSAGITPACSELR